MRTAIGLVVGLVLAVALWNGPATAQQTPSQAKPDLVPVDLAVEPADAEPGDSAQIVATMANRGENNAGSFWARLRVDGELHNARLVSGLDSGERFTWRMPWVVKPEAGELQLRVDATDRVAESDETNNEVTTEIGFAADLELSRLTLEPRFPEPGDAVQVQATVRNPSQLGVNRSFAVEIRVARSTIATRFVQQLPAGSSTTVAASWTAKAGAQLVRATADGFDRIAELNPDNNGAFLRVDVSERESTSADLAVRDVRLEPSDAEPGDRVSVQATVINTGNGDARAFKVGFWADGRDVGQTTVPGLASAASTVVSLNWATEAGQRRLRVQADADHVVPEADETNNGSALTSNFGATLEGCGQLVHLRLRSGAVDGFMAITGLGPEAIRNLVFPKTKRIMETQYDGINVRFVYERPGERHGTVAFRGDDESPILGQAPIGLRFNTGNVFLGSFVEFGLGSFAVSRIPILVGTVASHELGHMFGLRHPDQPQGGIMDASTQLSPVPGDTVPRFRDEARKQLESLLPMACN
ncbi:MAG: CARDB domain-containing protein [Candidatus Bipolaricaulia bacterium]